MLQRDEKGEKEHEHLYSGESLYKGRPAAQDPTVLRVRIKRWRLRSFFLRPVHHGSTGIPAVTFDDKISMVHEARTGISTVTPYDSVVSQSATGSLQRVCGFIGACARALRVQSCHSVHAFVPSMSSMVIAARLGPFVPETTAALVPLVATLGSFVAKGTGYALGAFVTALRAFVADETTAGLRAFVGEHARARAVPLVPAGGRHFSSLSLAAARLRVFRFLPMKIVQLRPHRRHFWLRASVAERTLEAPHETPLYPGQ